MIGMLQATLQRARLGCRQCVCRSMDWCSSSSSCPPCSPSSSSPSGCCSWSCSCCYPRCGSRRGRDRASRLGSFSNAVSSFGACICPCWVGGGGGSGGVSSGAGGSISSSGSGSSGGGGGTAGSHVSSSGGVCDWLSSYFLIDWIPLGMDSGPGPGGIGAASGGGGVGSGGGVSSGVGGGVGAVDGVGGSRRREVGGSGGGGAGGLAEGGGVEGPGLRRGASGGGGSAADDAKPLLSESESFEFREKERRFVKGRFVMPGSDVQRKIAEAMAGMLAAGGRVMTRTDSSGSAASLGRAGSSKGFNANRHSGGSVAGSGDGYSEIVDEEPAGSGVGGEAQCRPLGGDARPLGGSGRGRSGSRGSASRRSSPSRRGGVGTSPSPLETPRGGEAVRRGMGGVGAAGGGQEQERECVICMDDFSKEDPEMLTLCSCGVNKTFFHYSCLLQWLAKHSYCPACRGYLFFEERRTGAELGGRPSTTAGNGGGGGGGGGDGDGGGGGGRGRGRGSAAGTNEDYGQTLQRALRAGLDSTEGGGGGGQIN